MEINKAEVSAVQDAEGAINELSDLELACVGGGCGEVVFH